MNLWGALAQIVGWLMVGGVATVILVGLGVWLRMPILLYAAGGVLIATVTYGIGVAHEKAVCDARIARAEAKFEELQKKVEALVNEHKTITDTENEKEDQENAVQLKRILERLAKAANSKCTLDDADVADGRRVRNDGAAPAAGKR